MALAAAGVGSSDMGVLGTMATSGQQYFDENYRDYERQSSGRKTGFHLGLVRRWLPEGRPLFELGVGMGHFLEKAAAHYACQGSDLNAYGVEMARRRVPGVAVAEGSVERIPDLPGAAAVVAWDVLEHIPELDRALQVIRSRLGDQGLLIGVVPVYDGPLGWLVRRLDRDPTHLWKLSRSSWLARLQGQGFEVLEHGGIIRRLLFSRWYLHLTWPQALLRPFGSALYFVARSRGSPRPG